MPVQESKTMDIYITFQYKRGNNGKGTQTNLIDQRILENNGRFSSNADFYHTTTPDEFTSCPIKVFTVGPESFLIYTDKHKQEDDSILYNAKGLLIEPFLIPFLKMYFTVIFLPASLNSSIDVLLKIDKNLMAGLPDIFDGLIPVTIYVKLATFDHTIPHTVSRVRIFFPCPFRIFFPCPFRVHNMSKVFSVFTLPVWLSLALVFILTSATLWCLENVTYYAVSRQPYVVTSIPLVFPQRMGHFISNFSSENSYQMDTEIFICPPRVLLFCHSHCVSSVLRLVPHRTRICKGDYNTGRRSIN
jgi:hypothetical protein